MDNSKALERVKVLEPEVITTPTAFASAIAKWSPATCNLLTPFAKISGIAPHHSIFTAVVAIDPNPAAGEVYDGLPFLKKDEVALAKNGLRRIAEGLGISTELEHLAIRRHYWLIKARAKYKGVDGQTIVREATCEWDLWSGSPRLKGWTPAQVEEARKHGLRACETRAINAAIRECGCGVKQAYRRAELELPFVTVRVSFQPDYSDAGTRAAMLDAHLGATRALYPASGTSVDPWADEGEPAPRQVGRGTSADGRQMQQGAPAATATTSSTIAATSSVSSGSTDAPPAEGGVRIVQVKPISGQSNGKAWTRYVVVDSNGEEHSTFSKSIAESAEKFIASREWVEVVTQQEGKYRNVVEIMPAGQQPALPGTEAL